MTEVGFGTLVVRMLVSLAIVLAMVLGAYLLLRRRAGFVPGGGRPSRPSSTARMMRGAGAGRAGKPTSTRNGLRIVGRIGIGRTTQVVAVQFADKVFLLGTSEQQSPAVLSELDLEAWTKATEATDDVVATPIAVPGHPVASGAPAGATRPGLLDSLREATTRRG